MLILSALFIILLCVFSYALFIGWVLLKWKNKTAIPLLYSLTPSPGISVIVAARNEEDNIQTCLKALSAQEYPAHLWEIIVVDDGSYDRTKAIVEAFCQANPALQIRLLSTGNPSGKKTALNIGIQQAKHEWIITTDADCEAGVNWLKSMSVGMIPDHVKAIVGPVAIFPEITWLDSFQRFEQEALTATGAAFIQSRHPILCNGANFAYRKSAFNEIGGFTKIDGIASGDDVLLMNKLHIRYPGSIIFCHNAESIVRTKPQHSFKSLIRQRVRWASKTHYNPNPWNRLLAFFILLINCVQLLFFIKGCFHPVFLAYFLVLVLLKNKCDALLIYQTSKFFDQRVSWIRLTLLNILYPFYACTVFLYSIFGKKQWK